MASAPIKIIKGATPPPRARSAQRPWPFDDMEAGDAFDAPMACRATVSTICWQRKRDKSETYTIRKIDADTIRVWRLT